ncbi:hypothetical protein K1I42_09210, partial [Hydrogenophilus thermoluteolus]
PPKQTHTHSKAPTLIGYPKLSKSCILATEAELYQTTRHSVNPNYTALSRFLDRNLKRCVAARNEF